MLQIVSEFVEELTKHLGVFFDGSQRIVGPIHFKGSFC